MSCCQFRRLGADRRTAACIFRVGLQVYALDNFDPHSAANYIAGIVGDMQGELVVASPVYRHHFN
jgi:nitrite reductase/ring-hydroxylating ferredoxin subunit